MPDSNAIPFKINNLPPIQMEFYLKPKIFSDFFLSFLESTSNFKHFTKKDHPHTYFISDIKECGKRGYTTL